MEAVDVDKEMATLMGRLTELIELRKANATLLGSERPRSIQPPPALIRRPMSAALPLSRTSSAVGAIQIYGTHTSQHSRPASLLTRRSHSALTQMEERSAAAGAAARVTLCYMPKNNHHSQSPPHASQRLDSLTVDKSAQIIIEQLVYGSFNTVVFKGRLAPGETFLFDSHRRPGARMTLRVFKNGLLLENYSTCCEYKCRLGSKLGGPGGLIRIELISNAQPCLECRVTARKNGRDIDVAPNFFPQFPTSPSRNQLTSASFLHSQFYEDVDTELHALDSPIASSELRKTATSIPSEKTTLYSPPSSTPSPSFHQRSSLALPTAFSGYSNRFSPTKPKIPKPVTAAAANSSIDELRQRLEANEQSKRFPSMRWHRENEARIMDNGVNRAPLHPAFNEPLQHRSDADVKNHSMHLEPKRAAVNFIEDEEPPLVIDLKTVPDLDSFPASSSRFYENSSSMNGSLVLKVSSVGIARRNNFQISGHVDAFMPDSDPRWILKVVNGIEKSCFESFFGPLSGDPIKDIVPRLQGFVYRDGKEFIKMENLLMGYVNPNVMDCKIGVRTFLESDVADLKPRLDLLEKMDNVDKNYATAEERRIGVTKLRYMQFREIQSSSANLGFRIEASMKHVKELKEDVFDDVNALKRILSKQDVETHFRKFFEGRRDVIEKIRSKFHLMRDILNRSDFFAHHEMVGSSMLFLWDDSGKADVTIIDFGKTIPREDPGHNIQWNEATQNHADGYLIGFTSLQSVMESLLDSEAQTGLLVDAGAAKKIADDVAATKTKAATSIQAAYRGMVGRQESFSKRKQRIAQIQAEAAHTAKAVSKEDDTATLHAVSDTNVNSIEDVIVAEDAAQESAAHDGPISLASRGEVFNDELISKDPLRVRIQDFIAHDVIADTLDVTAVNAAAVADKVDRVLKLENSGASDILTANGGLRLSVVMAADNLKPGAVMGTHKIEALESLSLSIEAAAAASPHGDGKTAESNEEFAVVFEGIQHSSDDKNREAALQAAMEVPHESLVVHAVVQAVLQYAMQFAEEMREKSAVAQAVVQTAEKPHQEPAVAQAVVKSAEKPHEEPAVAQAIVQSAEKLHEESAAAQTVLQSAEKPHQEPAVAQAVVKSAEKPHEEPAVPAPKEIPQEFPAVVNGSLRSLLLGMPQLKKGGRKKIATVSPPEPVERIRRDTEDSEVEGVNDVNGYEAHAWDEQAIFESEEDELAPALALRNPEPRKQAPLSRVISNRTMSSMSTPATVAVQGEPETIARVASIDEDDEPPPLQPLAPRSSNQSWWPCGLECVCGCTCRFQYT